MPVPKVSNPLAFSDFRPIAVTPALSRLTETLLVRYWLRPALSTLDPRDQFAFRPTGSTNCALINCFDYITRMLECNTYVRCMLTDFSKAFDIVNHAIVISKLNSLNIHAPIKNAGHFFLNTTASDNQKFMLFFKCAEKQPQH
jgi:Reverse transcriptase (RNA-dependent DNA polymerase)